MNRLDASILLYSGLTILLLSACNECRNEDCPEVNFLDIQVESETDTIHVFDIEFYFYDRENQRVAADIERARRPPNTFYAFLDYRQPALDNKYYITVQDLTREVQLTKNFQETECCGTQVRFEEVIVDGSSVDLPIRVVFD